MQGQYDRDITDVSASNADILLLMLTRQNTVILQYRYVMG